MKMMDSPAGNVLERFLDLCAFRHGLIASNMANIDTPGYRTRDVSFADEMRRVLDGLYQSEPAVHEVPGLIQRPDGNNVSLEREGLNLAETQLQFRTAVELLRSEFRRLQTAINEGK